jgi:dTDP-4-dehydrorhamnose 3,5-epimerase
MKKQILPLKVVFSDEGLIIRSSDKLIDDVRARRAKVISDHRGRLGEIMRADDDWFEKFGQVYFTTTYPGVVKAWHQHKKQTDHFYVNKGTIKVALYDERKESATYGTVNEVYLGEHCPGLLRVPPCVQHGWMCVGPTEAYIVNIVSEVYNYTSPDEFRTDPHDNHIPYDWTHKDG